MARDIKFEIVKEIGVLSESSKGWKKELNIVSWNDGAPKYDLRDWDPEQEFDEYDTYRLPFICI